MSKQLDTYSLKSKQHLVLKCILFLYDKAHRQSLSQFCTSAHTLEIERGRWRRREREERLCLYRNTNNVETEMHALPQCSKHNDVRLEYYAYMLQNNKHSRFFKWNPTFYWNPNLSGHWSSASTWQMCCKNVQKQACWIRICVWM